MFIRRIYAVLSKRCGWSLEYIGSLDYRKAVWHVENLDHMDREDNNDAMNISIAPYMDKPQQSKLRRTFSAWSRPRKVKIRKKKHGV